jgi:outer membrane protein insertion porin family
MNHKYFLSCLIIIFLSGCGNVKYLNEGEQLYMGGEVEVESEDISGSERKMLEENMEGLLRPKPNTSILGLRPHSCGSIILQEVKKQIVDLPLDKR